MFEISNKKIITNQLSCLEEISILLVRAVLFVLWKFSDQRKPSVSPQWKLVLINNLLFTNSSLQLCKFKKKNFSQNNGFLRAIKKGIKSRQPAGCTLVHKVPCRAQQNQGRIILSLWLKDDVWQMHLRSASTVYFWKFCQKGGRGIGVVLVQENPKEF